MENIFPQIIRTIKAGEPEDLEYTDIKPEDASQLISSLRHPSNHLETYGHRYVVPFQRWCWISLGHMRGNWFRIHYSNLTHRFKIVMPTRLHACIGSWIVKCCCQWAMAGLLPPQWGATMDMLGAPDTSENQAQKSIDQKSID